MLKLFLTTIFFNLVLQQVYSTVLKVYTYPSNKNYFSINSFVDDRLTLLDAGVLNLDEKSDSEFIKNSVYNIRKILDLEKRNELYSIIEEINLISNLTAILYKNKYKKEQNVKIYWEDTSTVAKILQYERWMIKVFDKFDNFIHKNFMRLNSSGISNSTYADIYKNFCETGLTEIQTYNNVVELIKFAFGRYFVTRILLFRFQIVHGIMVTHSNSTYDIIKMLYEYDVNLLKKKMLTSSLEIWSCPLNNDDFLKLPVFQKYFIAYHDEKKCSDIKKLGSCHKFDPVCKKTRLCPGNLHCSDIHKNTDTIVDSTILCLSNDTQAKARYNSVAKLNDDDEIFTCSTRSIKSVPHLPSSCDCVCEEKNVYVSLQPQQANNSLNFVVTGIKFVLEHETNYSSTLYIQIQQGKLLPNGDIDSNTVSWKPISKNNGKRVRISYNGIRKIDLTRNKLPDDHVVTGVSLHIQERDPNRLSIKLFADQLNFTAGTLVFKSTYTQVTKPASKQLDITNGKINNTSTKPIKPSLYHNSFVELTTSSLIENGGQTTIPFLDSREVVTKPPAPLTGISLTHLGQKGLGGVLSFKLYTFNFVRHIGTYLMSPDENGVVALIRDGIVIRVKDN